MSLENQNRYSITVDDDPIISRTIEAITQAPSLSYSSFDSFRCHERKDAPMAVFIDIHLGLDENGIDLIPTIRDNWPYCPIIVVTTNPSGDAVGQALAAGAHDFVRKPFDQRELSARLRARSFELQEKACRETMNVGDFVLNTQLSELKGPAGCVHLSHSDTRLLQFLAQAQGTVVSRPELKRRVWGNVSVSDNALDKKLHDVRAAIREVGSQIKLTSSYRQGFSLIVPNDAGTAL